MVNFSTGNNQLFGTLAWTSGPGKARLISSPSHQKDPLKDRISRTNFTLSTELHSFSLCHLLKWLSFVLKSTTWNLVHVASNPYIAAFSLFWEKVKITLIWKYHQNLPHTVKYFLDEEWRKESRDEISNPMLTAVALVLNKVNFTTQIFAPDCPHCRAIHCCKTMSSSLPTLNNKATFWNKSWFFLSKRRTRLRCWIFYQNNSSSHRISSDLQQKLITISTVTANAWQ